MTYQYQVKIRTLLSGSRPQTLSVQAKSVREAGLKAAQIARNLLNWQSIEIINIERVQKVSA